MTARRVRSAESCRFIASWTSRGGVISRISTVVTLPPQRSVTSSSLTRRTSLICSRFDSTSSSEDVADDGAQRRRRDALEGAGEVRDVDDALERIADPPVDQEVDVDRGVVLGDRRLARDLDELLADVDLDRPVDDRDEEPEARVADHRLVRLAEPEHDHLLVLLDDPDRQVQDHEQDDDDERDDGDRDDDGSSTELLPVVCRQRSAAGDPARRATVRPSMPTTWTGVPRSSGRSSAVRAVHSSPRGVDRAERLERPADLADRARRGAAAAATAPGRSSAASGSPSTAISSPEHGRRDRGDARAAARPPATTGSNGSAWPCTARTRPARSRRSRRREQAVARDRSAPGRTGRARRRPAAGRRRSAAGCRSR